MAIRAAISKCITEIRVMSRKFRTNRKRPEAKQDISRFPEPGDGGDQVATAKRLGLDGAACG